MKKRRRPSGKEEPSQSSTASPLETLLDLVLNEQEATPCELQDVAESVRHCRLQDKRAVVLGGGTGMSTIVGGNSQLSSWTARPFVGLKSEFGRVDVIACTTDDGGSTGDLLKYFPMIGIGDLRKSCISLVQAEPLQRTYATAEHESVRMARLIHRIFTYRFPWRAPDRRMLEDPIRCVPLSMREGAPAELVSGLRVLGGYMKRMVGRLGLNLCGHSLGNLLLTSAVFRAAGGRLDRPPSARELRTGLDHVARLIGAAPGRLHAATATPGQLSFRYSNGVEVYGQSKAGIARRDVSVERVRAVYAGKPVVGQATIRAIRDADVIIYAPGSLYSSMIPVLQLPDIVGAIRANRRAYRILAANFWIQEGETDISPGDEARGYYVSDLLEAYDLNIPGGAQGLFDVVLCSNLERLPGHILRNYALEGKRPIHLNRAQVEAMGFLPVEAMLFSPGNLSHAGVIHHDAGLFAMAVRTFMYLCDHASVWKKLGLKKARTACRRKARVQSGSAPKTDGVVLSAYLTSVKKAIARKRFTPDSLREVLLDLVWENRDLSPAHLAFFEKVCVIPSRLWRRSVEWDNVLGYYDPMDCTIKLHAQLLRDPVRLKRDLLIALGESLLGRYIESRCWKSGRDGARSYEIRLRRPGARRCLLSDKDLCRYLRLARMVPDRKDPLRFRITVNDDEGFLPAGLLFGLLFAWYLNNSYGGVMEYEMSLLRWSEDRLVPYQAKERQRKDELVRFFRTVVFRHSGL